MTASLSEEQVRRVALLARLHLPEGSSARLARELSRVLDYVSKLNELDVAGIEPMSHAIDLHSVQRDDRCEPALPVDAVLANAAEHSAPFFMVPKVLADEGGA